LKQKVAFISTCLHLTLITIALVTTPPYICFCTTKKCEIFIKYLAQYSIKMYNKSIYIKCWPHYNK